MHLQSHIIFLVTFGNIFAVFIAQKCKKSLLPSLFLLFVFFSNVSEGQSEPFAWNNLAWHKGINLSCLSFHSFTVSYEFISTSVTFLFFLFVKDNARKKITTCFNLPALQVDIFPLGSLLGNFLNWLSC